MRYVGRFAPSPSGPLHLGSLLAAVGSLLDARHHAGTWILRVDDLDPYRSKALHESTILTQLACHGVTTSPSPLRPSLRTEAYRAALQQLQHQGLIFACTCRRKQRLAQVDTCCEQNCRTAKHPLTDAALRVDLSGLSPLRVDDRSLGEIIFDPSRHRDVIVWRRDQVAAYHLAIVVDDAAQEITHIVRGADLAASVPWQIALQSLLRLPQPAYLHLPVLTDHNGRKLSKSDYAAPLTSQHAVTAVRRVLHWLRQISPPETLTVKELLEFAAENWQPGRFKRTASVPLD